MRRRAVLVLISIGWVMTVVVGWDVVRHAGDRSFYLMGMTAMKQALTEASIAAGERKETTVSREDVLAFFSGPAKEAIEAGRIRIVSGSVELNDQQPPKAKGGFVFEIDGSVFVLEADGNVRPLGR